MSYGRRGEQQLEPMCLVELTESCVQLARMTLSDEIKLTWTRDESEVLVLADQFRLQQSILGMIENAGFAVSSLGNGVVGHIVVEIEPSQPQGRVGLRISDNGPGVPPETAARIFDPFFTTRPVGTGTGMGLALAMRCVRDVGGELSYETTEAGGASFLVVLDRHQRMN